MRELSVPDADGYRVIQSIEVDGRIGVKVLVKAPVGDLKVFDWEAMRPTPQSFVGFGIEAFVERIEMANAMIDPKVLRARDQERLEIVTLFHAAQLAPIHIKMIPNEYCGRHCCYGKPWFVVTTRVGPIKIGQRKRVTNIDWSESDVKSTAAQLFASEEVTQGDKYIHAWNFQKAKEYLIRITQPAR